ncbi:MAG: YggT family protein [Candidatus Binatia bacterium]
MFLFANLFVALASAVDIILTFYLYLVLARVIISWVNADPRNAIVRFIYSATEPLLYRVRRVVPPMGGLDLSPLVLSAAIYFLNIFLVRTLVDLAQRL